MSDPPSIGDNSGSLRVKSKAKSRKWKDQTHHFGFKYVATCTINIFIERVLT